MRRLLPALLFLLLGGCLTAEDAAGPFAGLRSPDGSVLWQGEYRFVPPRPPWQLLKLDETDYSIAFFRGCSDETPATYPCESTFAYAEEPFGYSREFEERQREFFRRFLWAARVDFEQPELTPARALGGEALQAETVGHERVLGHKVLVRVLFARRGERVVAFYFTQWRPADRPFDRSQLTAFDDFVARFDFAAPSFYQKLTGTQ
ncbi:MAG: hypothetical protein GWO11_00970 [Desulfuromonadales bacterium]|nr:hypothetical protein [Desulfuromonadales bacterium]NIR33082.1 hypothetical protein [Desulfuromonadales bacterium]NIS39320.1 hypothetical protein [Desulfuromonadales bacterium]